MKQFMKKANRGLLLTSVVFTIMCIYILGDYISFQSEKNTINETINNYFSDIYQINTSADGNSENQKKEITKIIDTYWTSEEPSIEWCTTKARMQNNVTCLFDELSLETTWLYDISSVDFKINGMKIQKSGPGYAKVTLSYTTSITGKAGSYAITPSNYRILDESYSETVYTTYNYGDISKHTLSEEKQKELDELKNELGTLKYSVEECIIELHYEGGNWKICGIDAYEYNSSFTSQESE